MRSNRFLGWRRSGLLLSLSALQAKFQHTWRMPGPAAQLKPGTDPAQESDKRKAKQATTTAIERTDRNDRGTNARRYPRSSQRARRGNRAGSAPRRRDAGVKISAFIQRHHVALVARRAHQRCTQVAFDCGCDPVAYAKRADRDSDHL